MPANDLVTVCKCQGCTAPAKANGLCAMHLQRWYVCGSPDMDEFLRMGCPTAGAYRRMMQHGPVVGSVGDKGDVLVVASDPGEMVASQHEMIAVVGRKFDAAVEGAREAAEVVSQLVTAGMDSRAAKRRHKAATQVVVYYSKVKQALEAGYVMMPDMRAETIAIRVDDRRKPRQRPTPQNSQHWAERTGEEPCDQLEIGDGMYVDPFPVGWIDQWQETQGEREVTRYMIRDLEWSDEPVGLPARFERPTVVERVSAALKGKIFDEVAVVEPVEHRRRSADPIVLGRVRGAKKSVAFMIAWFVDTTEI